MKARLGLLLVLVVAGFRLANLHYAELRPYDESIHASWARAVAEHGCWLDQRDYPVFNYQSRRYPPLFMWILALAFKAFGVSEAVARSVAAGSGVLLVLLAFASGRWLGGGSLGVWMALSIGLNHLLTHFSRSAMLESLYLLFMAGAFAAHLRGLEDGRRRWPVLAGAAFGLCLMTKGVLALIFPAAALLCALASRRALPATSRFASPPHAAWRLAGACAIGFLVAAPWHAFLLVTQRGAFVYDYFLWNVLERVATGVDNPPMPLGPLHYVNQLPLRMPIEIVFFVAAIAGIVSAARARGTAGPGSGGDRLPAARLLLLCWFVAAFVPLSLARSKPDQYMVPMLLPALALAATEIDALWSRNAWSRHSLLVAALPLTLLWAHAMPYRLALKRSLSALAAFRAPDSADLLVAAAGSGAILLLAAAALRLRKTRPALAAPRRVLPALAVLSALLVGHRTFVVEPPLYDSGAPRVVDRLARAPIRHLSVVSVSPESPIIYYLGVPDAAWQRDHLALIQPNEFPETLGALPRGAGEFVLVDRSDYEERDRWGRQFFGERLGAVDRVLAPNGTMLLETRRYQLWELVE